MGWLLLLLGAICLVSAIIGAESGRPYFIASGLACFPTAVFFFALDKLLLLLGNIKSLLTWLMPDEYFEAKKNASQKHDNDDDQD